MSRKRSGYAKTSFAFAATLQSAAESAGITVDSFKVEAVRKDSGSYDTLVATFHIPRPDRDETDTLDEDSLEKIVQDVEASISEMEV